MKIAPKLEHEIQPEKVFDDVLKSSPMLVTELTDWLQSDYDDITCSRDWYVH